MTLANQNGQWTPRDYDLLETLALKVRILTLPQIAGGWWSESANAVPNARRRLRQLVTAGLLRRCSLSIHPILKLTMPICSWNPGDCPLDPGAVSWKLCNRWTEAPQAVTTYSASRQTVNLLASYGGSPPDFQHATHDAHVAEVYLWYLRHDPSTAAIWLGEDAFPKAGYRVKDPDAFAIGPDGNPTRAIEFGGRYDAERVADFHQHCAERRLPYEIW